MMKTMISIILLVSLCAPLRGQSIERHLVASAGGMYSGPVFSSDFSIGETVMHTLQGAGIILTQGFQQPPYEPTPLPEYPPTEGITLYPNPGNGQFFLHRGQVQDGSLQVSVYDLLGQLLYSREWETNATALLELNLGHLATGTYYLRVDQAMRHTTIPFVMISR